MTEVTAMDDHERVLDYAYDMLSAGEKASFEAHLVTCARCQAELAAMGHVRQVVKAALPMVEPSARLTGALHAQLMHEAAQRRRMGKVLPFMRRVLKHPAYAAAASVLIIGGAVGVQWSRGRLFMPVPEAAAPAASGASETAAPPPSEAAPVTAAPVAAPVDENALLEKGNQVTSPEPMLKNKASNAHGSSLATRSSDGAAYDKKSADPFGEIAKDAYSVNAKPEPAKKVAEQKEEVLRQRAVEKPRAKSPSDALDDLVVADERRDHNAEREGAVQGKLAPGSPTPTQRRAPAAEAPAASVAPAAPRSAAPRAEAAKADADSSLGGVGGGYGRAGASANAPGSRGLLEEDRKRAADFAHSGRCDDAVAAYASLEQRGPLSATERGYYDGCLRRVRAAASRKQGQQQQAPARSKALKAAPTPQNADTEQRK